MRGLLSVAAVLVVVGVACGQDPLTHPDTVQAERDVKTVLMWVGGGLAVLFVPFAVAVVRGHNNALAIGAVCLLLGWTGVGWLLAGIWSLTGNTRASERRKARLYRR